MRLKIFAWKEVCDELDVAAKELARLHNHPIEISYNKSARGLINVTVINKGERDERVKSVEMYIYDKKDVVVDVLDHTSRRHNITHLRGLTRCEGFPHVMPPLSSFEVEFLISTGTFMAYAHGGFYISVKLEDGTVIESERNTMRRPSESS